jgi:phosphoenolpyruvate synthase/pyruvate phosphate dikinase
VANQNNYIRWSEDLRSKDVAIVGGKNASLGEMIRSSKKEGVRVPDGSATTSEAYWELLEVEQLREKVHLLPVDEEWLKRLRAKSWPTRILPTYTMDWDSLFSALIREYLFISLFWAFAESLASENASRLASMQAAEKNIEEQLSELKRQFDPMRQMAITEELLDIVAGFEALTS